MTKIYMTDLIRSRLVVIALFLTCPYCAFSESITPEQRIDSIPLPQGERAKQDVDFDKVLDLNFIQTHGEFSSFSPFCMELGLKKPIPYHAFKYFLSDKSPREIYIFFKHYFNLEDHKSVGQRAKPYYNPVNSWEFDVKNVGDVPFTPDSANAVFYSIAAHANDFKETLLIYIFNKGTGDKTVVYLTAYDK